MTKRSLRRTCAAFLLVSVFSTACGLKGDQLKTLDAQSQGGGGLVEGPAVDTDGDGAVDAPADPGSGGAVDPGTSAGGGTSSGGGGTSSGGGGTSSGGGGTSSGGGGTSSGGGGTSSGGGGTSSGGGGTTSTKGTKTGVTADEIRIGIHAPLTGASPLPSESFQRGARNYWLTRKVFGRKVTVEVLDDTYKPSGAVRVCQEMARRDFIVVGGAGTDQIQACGRDRTLQRANTPYLSAGVTENGLRGVPNYFAISTSYKDQAPLVIQSATIQQFLTKANSAGEKKWAVVLSETPNFTDAKQAIEAQLKSKGVDYKYFGVPKAGSDSDAISLARELRTYNAPVVYILGQPTFFLKVLAQTGSTYTPTWTGVGISFGINQVHTAACGATQNRYDGRFLSPYPGLDKAPKAFLDADGGRAKDDIELTLWGLSELLEQALLTTKGNLTRENFIASMATASLPGGTYPGVKYTPSNHFGGTKMWQLKSNCGGSPNQYVTVGSAPIG